MMRNPKMEWEWFGDHAFSAPKLIKLEGVVAGATSHGNSNISITMKNEFMWDIHKSPFKTKNGSSIHKGDLHSWVKPLHDACLHL